MTIFYSDYTRRQQYYYLNESVRFGWRFLNDRHKTEKKS